MINSLVRSIVILILFIRCFTSFSQNVLWIGNSYTGFNHLPELFKAMAWQYGFEPKVTSRLIGGSSLFQHSQDSVVTNLIMSKPWDIVIIQPNGIEMARPLDTVILRTLPHLRKLDSLAKLSNSCVRTLIYQPFNNILGIPFLCSQDPTLCTYLGASARTIANTNYLSAQTNIPIVRVGSAFRAHFLQGNFLKLWHQDNLHCSYEGSFLAACMFYQAVYGLSPTSSTFIGRNNVSVAAGIKGLAQAVYDSTQYNYLPHIAPYQLSVQVNNNIQTTTLTAASPNGLSYAWHLNGSPAGNATSVSFSTSSTPIVHLTAHRNTNNCFAGSYKRYFSNQNNGNSARRFIRAVNINNYSTMVGQQLGYTMKNDTVVAHSKGQLICHFSPGHDVRNDTSFVVWRVYLDKNKNNVFSTAEMIFESEAGKKPVAATINIPPAIASGVYKLRIVMHDPDTKDNPNTNTVEYEGATFDCSLRLIDALCNPQQLQPFKITTYSATAAEIVWPYISGISNYRVQFKTLSANGWLNKAVINSNSTIFDSLTPGQEYSFRIAPSCNGVWNYTPEVVYKHPSSLKNCSRPDVKAIATSPTGVHVSWTPMHGVTQYHLRYRLSGSNSAHINFLQLQSTSLSIGHLTPGTGYNFQVRALCASNNSWTSFSNLTTVTTPGQAPLLLAKSPQVRAYPNPGRDQVEIEAPANRWVRVFNWQGQVADVSVTPTPDGYLIETDRLTPGSYLIQIVGEQDTETLIWLKSE